MLPIWLTVLTDACGSWITAPKRLPGQDMPTKIKRIISKLLPELTEGMFVGRLSPLPMFTKRFQDLLPTKEKILMWFMTPKDEKQRNLF